MTFTSTEILFPLVMLEEEKSETLSDEGSLSFSFRSGDAFMESMLDSPSFEQIEYMNTDKKYTNDATPALPASAVRKVAFQLVGGFVFVLCLSFLVFVPLYCSYWPLNKSLCCCVVMRCVAPSL
jgi:hypothetical protein